MGRYNTEERMKKCKEDGGEEKTDEKESVICQPHLIPSTWKQHSLSRSTQK